MTIARKYLIDPSQTCFYHCMSRCIDQRFLLRNKSKQSDSRRAWIESWLLYLGDIFAIDVLAYSIMENHTHTVLHINRPLADSWVESEVLKRRAMLGRIPDVCYNYLEPAKRSQLKEVEVALVYELVSRYRRELSDISKFMQRFNSHIAQKANKEDGRKGHFWEGRFKSQALLTEEAILACMTYVDLNPHRAGIANTINEANFTSIRHRLSIAKDLAKTKMLPFRKTTQFDLLPNVSQLGLLSYIETINRMTSNKRFIRLKTVFDNFVEDDHLWQKMSLESINQMSLTTEDKELVSKFNERALWSYNEARKHHVELTVKILSELRDIRYQSGKKRHAT